jgi:four helix bundle protein
MAGYRDIKVWQGAMRLATEVYRLSAQFPKHETYGLSSQIQRSAVFVPSNIAEGHGRNSNKEFYHFLGVALGSLSELETQIILAQQLGYLTEEIISPALEISSEVAKMIKACKNPLHPTND